MDERKLVSPYPSNGVTFVGTSEQPIGEETKHRIAGRVTKGVIDTLEAVQIDE